MKKLEKKNVLVFKDTFKKSIYKHTFKKVLSKDMKNTNTKEIASDIATNTKKDIQDMQIIHIDDLTIVERVNLLYSILRSTFDYEVLDEPEIKKTSYKLKHMITLFLKMYNSDD